MDTPYEHLGLSSEQAIETMVSALGEALHGRDLATHAHSQRVICYALTLGRILGVSQTELFTLKRGVYLHDVGKIYIPDQILRKAGRLSETEWSVMRRHPVIGYGLVSSIPSLLDAAKIVLTHHERYDGSGYPHGLKGAEIPLGARIFSVVDTLDAITSDRPYRKPVNFAEAREQVAAESGTHFDPDIIDVFTMIRPECWQQLRCCLARTMYLPH